VSKADGSGGYESKLVRIDRPILRVPSLAIHLNREVNSEGLKLSTESHLAPVLATVLRTALEGPATTTPAPAVGGAGAGAPVAGTGGALTRHHSSLVRVIAAELGVAPDAVADWDLSVYDTQPAAIGGLHEEFIFSGEGGVGRGGGGGEATVRHNVLSKLQPVTAAPPIPPLPIPQLAWTICS